MMPPDGRPRPDRTTSHALVSWLESTLDRAATTKPNPGRPLVHRLNRAEYANAIRDLLALEVDPSSLLPPDDSGYGFDNIADVLGVSPVLLERYLTRPGRSVRSPLEIPNRSCRRDLHRSSGASQDQHIVVADRNRWRHGSQTTLPLEAITSSRSDCSEPTWAPCAGSKIHTSSRCR